MTTGSGISRAPRPSSLADVLDLILDKGLVIDAYVRISAVGIELLTIDARIVIASVDTYLHYAEAVNRLDLTQTETQGLTGIFGENSSNDSSNGSSDGQSRNGQRSGASKGRSVEGGRSRGGSGERALGRAPARAERSGGRRGGEQEDGGQDEQSRDDEEGGEGLGRTLARRIGEKGRWS